MEKKLSIINIDGTEGSGKTTQISHLAGFFRISGIPVLINYLDDTITSALECSEKTRKFLEKNPDGLVINDGSIARMIVVDLVQAVPQLEVMEKYRTIIHEHEVLNHTYGMANVLMVLEDLEECNQRLQKLAKLTELNSQKIIDVDVENYIVAGIKNFDNNIISRNLSFYVIDIDKEDSILEIKDNILEYLRDNFKIKKPFK